MTRSTLKLKVLAGLLLAAAGSASAATYTNVPGGATNSLPLVSFGNAANPSSDTPALGEVFSLSAASVLSSFSFYAIGNTNGAFQLNLATWNAANNTIGTVTTFGTATDTFDAATGMTTIGFSNIGASLAAGTSYVAFMTSSDPSLTGVQFSRTQTAQDTSGFGKGFAYLSTIPGSGWQFPFNGNGFLSLEYTAVTAAVPEPETYALMLAGLGLLGFAARRKKQQ